MPYYYVNTEARNLPGQNPHEVWIATGYAYVSGDEYGPKLGRLDPGDILFMYVNGQGVMAVGRVLEPWNGQPVDPPMIYAPAQGPEYRIAVDWFLRLINNPVNPAVLREIIGWTPIGALQRVNDDAAAARLLDHADHARNQADRG